MVVKKRFNPVKIILRAYGVISIIDGKKHMSYAVGSKTITHFDFGKYKVMIMTK